MAWEIFGVTNNGSLGPKTDALTSPSCIPGWWVCPWGREACVDRFYERIDSFQVQKVVQLGSKELLYVMVELLLNPNISD